jgi:hypothetical protein
MTDRSAINDPNDFVPRATKPSKWAKWFEGGEPNVSLVGEAIDYSVDFAVKETAREKANRIWGMVDACTKLKVLE